MKRKIRRFAKPIGSVWSFRLILSVFTLEAGWLALTSRYPMAYDESYHFGLIRFFAHRLDPIVVKQAADTYMFGPLVHNTPPLYHYLLSFEYRFVDLFTSSTEIHLICLRLTNVALAVASLIVIRKLLRLLRIPDALANTLLIILALTPMMTVVSAQVNYDNLFILATSVCVYEAILFTRQLDKGLFDARQFLVLICLCLYSSLIKFAFLPIFVAIALIVIWKIIAGWRQDAAGLAKAAQESFAGISWRMKSLLIGACMIGILLFSWFYMVNLVKYANPAPQCDQLLTVQQCEHYGPWRYLHSYQQYFKAHPVTNQMGPLGYSAWWLQANFAQTYGTQIPLNGTVGESDTYLLIVMLVGTAGFIFFLGNLRGILRQYPEILLLLIVTFIYLFCLWARNYQDYRSIGLLAAAVHGRYMLPVMIYVYIPLALGLQYVLKRQSILNAAIKSGLALVVILLFVYFGGFREYLSFVNPAYGRLSPSDFTSNSTLSK